VVVTDDVRGVDAERVEQSADHHGVARQPVVVAERDFGVAQAQKVRGDHAEPGGEARDGFAPLVGVKRAAV